MGRETAGVATSLLTKEITAQLPYITYTNKTHSKGTVQMKLCTQSEVRAVKTGTGRADKLERRC